MPGREVLTKCSFVGLQEVNVISTITTLKKFVLAGVVALLALALPAAAANKTPYSPEAFKAAQTENRPILVEIHADWCPTCKAQAPIVDSLSANPKYKDLMIFRIDFDSQKSIVREFGAQAQSTLIVFKGKTETGRSIGDTQRDSIAALLEKSL